MIVIILIAILIASYFVTKAVNKKKGTDENQDKSNKKWLKILISTIILVVGLLTLSILITNINKFTGQGNVKTPADIGTNSNKTQNLSLDKVEIGREFKSGDTMNESTKQVLACAWQEFTKNKINVNMHMFKIEDVDNYGRVCIRIEYFYDTDKHTRNDWIVIGEIDFINEIYYTYSNRPYGGGTLGREQVKNTNGWNTPLPSR